MIDIYFHIQKLLQEVLSPDDKQTKPIFVQPGIKNIVPDEDQFFLQPGVVDMSEGTSHQPNLGTGDDRDIRKGISIGVVEALGDEDISFCSIGYYVTVTLAVASSEAHSVKDARCWMIARMFASLVSDIPNVPKPQGFVGFQYFEEECDLKPKENYNLSAEDLVNTKILVVSPTGQEGYDRQQEGNFHVFYRTFLVGVELE